ncbi:hypothetical protein FDP08_08890 [Marinobacter panjinensis]|uniref:Alginate export domain-containing protein n=1 Tax=Marinobacter panjinensis TaxID=2576384 RepID=A0A4U6R3K0_9GAMM|nr:hypothetical protein [Marinobacter panjinensis]MCR8916342.1 alginate export family protein [Marinobacter panjinensis]TKV68200.1 hypothetical protein FDP08_08890 [Marinobacter panjinensis]
MNKNRITHSLLYLALVGLSAPASAYNFYNQDGTELNLDIEAMLGVFSSQETYNLGAKSEAGETTWQEGFIKYGLSGSHIIGANSSVYGALNLVSSGTWGDGDAGGFSSGNERRTALEDAYVGWRSGDLIQALGQDGLDISVGRQAFTIGDGFLVNGDSLNFGDALNPLLGVDLDRGGAYWLAARKAFDQTAIARIGGSDGLRADLFWLDSDNKAQAQMELAGANAEYVTPRGTFGLTYIEGLDVDDDIAPLLGYNSRDGQQTVSLRYQGNAGIENLFLSGEFVTQEPGDSSFDDAKAWYAEAGWTFSDVIWSPSVNYRYSSFEENFDPLFFGFNRGYGTWFQGEVAANYAGPFNSDADVHHVGLKATPSETLSVGALFFNFRDTAGGSGNLNAQEIDLYAEWVAAPHLIISPLVGVYTPDNSAAEGGSQIGSDDTNVYGQIIAIVPF